jgi:hypothetical protein
MIPPDGDRLRPYTTSPTGLRPIIMRLIDDNYAQDNRTLLAAVVGVRYDIQRLIEVLERRL